MRISDDIRWKHTMFLSELIGLSPYQSNFKRRLGCAFYCITNGCMLAATISCLVKIGHEDFADAIDHTIECILICTCIMGYLIYYGNALKIRRLDSELYIVSRGITDPYELKILRGYTTLGRKMTWISTACYTMLAVILVNVTSTSKNFTRREFWALRAHYFFFEQEDHPVLAEFHIITCLVTNVILGIITANFFILGVTQVCGLFAVVRHRMGNIVVFLLDEEGTEEVSVEYTRQNIARAVTLHDQTLRVSKLFDEMIARFYLICQIPVVITLSTLYYVLIKVETSTERKIIICACIIICNITVAVANWMGQEIINHEEKIFDKVYSCEWYSLPVSEQRSVLFILQRSHLPNSISDNKLSIEKFGRLTKLSWRGFSVLKYMS